MGKRKTNTDGLFEIQKINQKHLSSVAFQIIENIQQYDGYLILSCFWIPMTQLKCFEVFDFKL
jgi:hypothetical protein